MAIERENAHQRSEACACTRAAARRRGQANAPKPGALRGVNVAILRQMRGKIAKLLSCNDIKFNIMQIMRLSWRNAVKTPPGRKSSGGMCV